MEEKRGNEERESKTREGVFPSLRIPNPNHPISCQSPKTPNQLFHFNLTFFLSTGFHGGWVSDWFSGYFNLTGQSITAYAPVCDHPPRVVAINMRSDRPSAVTFLGSFSTDTLTYFIEETVLDF